MRESLNEQGVQDPHIYATSTVALNTRDPLPYISESVELSSQERTLLPDDWFNGAPSLPAIETPRLDQLKLESAWLSDFYVHPVCTPTRAALMTGRHPQRTQAIDTYIGRAMLEPEEVTIAEVLQEAGWGTGIFGKWHLGDIGFHPENSGFDINIGGNKHGGPGGYFSPYKYTNMDDGPKGEYLTDRIGDEVVNFIENNKEKARS